MKEKIFIILLAVLILSGNIEGNVLASQATSQESLAIEQNYAISPRAEIIDWRYKVVNGVLYKRLYNYTRQEWVGKWIRVG